MPESQIISIVRVVQARGQYPGSYRVLFTEPGTPIQSTYVTGMDELDAYRRAKRWLDEPQT